MKKQSLMLCLALAFTYAQGMYDYNGNPLTRNGSITITPQTSSATIASYTKAVNLDGLVDKTFGINGKAAINHIEVNDGAYACMLQPDGKIITAGYSDSDFAVVRYNTNGSVDSSFGPDRNGIVTTNLGGTDIARACVLQPDGKIIAAGYTITNDFYDNDFYDFALVRYNTDGSLDSSFGVNGNGIIITDLGGNEDGAYACVLQPDGKIIAAGYTSIDVLGSVYNFALVRYNSDRTLDATFGTDGNGIVKTDIEGDDRAQACVLQPDGKIIAAGYTGLNKEGVFYNIALIRYNTNGSIDTTFGTNGIVTTKLGDVARAFACALQPDGKIIAAGTSKKDALYDYFALVRYNTDGTLDTTFGTNGIVTTDLGRIDGVQACMLQLDGKIVVAGYTNKNNDDTYDWALVRYNTDGTLDTSFGINGMVITDVKAKYDFAQACVLQLDGKIVIAGYCDDGISTDSALVRYINPFTLETFTASYGNVGLL